MWFSCLLATLESDELDFVQNIYEQYGAYMYHTAYSVLRNREDAEDAVSDAMCKIIKFISKFKGNTANEIQNKVVICIRSTVKNKAIDHYNKRKRRLQKETSLYADADDGEERMLEIEDESADTEQLVIKSETRSLIRAALLKLPEAQRDAVNLVYLCGYSCVEAAEFLGVSDGAVRARLFKARANLKEMLSKELSDCAEP